MTIDEAIKHCLEVAEKQSRFYSLCPLPCDGTKDCMSLKNGKDMGCVKCATDHRQLAEWLMELKDLKAEQNDQYVFIHELMSELKESKRLLKAAVEDFNCDIDSICAICKHNDLVDGCPYIERYSECEYKWRYTDEAENLIGGSEND